jgi:NDP-sugar pyrophosphorylase family protein
MPKHMIGEPKSIVPITEKVIIQIDHWCNLWAANIGVLLANTAKIAKASKWKLLLLALKAHSTNQWKVLHKTNTIGQNCDIHPTAYIEGSIIRDDVTIGAGVVIRQSVVGDGVNILNNATIDTSVIGDSAYIGSSSMIQYSVLYPGTFILARVISLSTTGKDTFLGDNVTLTDFRLDGQNIAVMKDGVLIDTGNRLLGPCIGHGVYLAAGSIVGPGREIPNELRLAPMGERTIRKCNPGGNIEGYQVIQKHTGPLD